MCLTGSRDRNFVVTMITPVAINSIGYKYYIVFTCIGFCIPFLIYFYYPEVRSPTPSLQDPTSSLPPRSIL